MGKALWIGMFNEIFKNLPDEIQIIESEMDHWQW
jgi:hypothetical protein